MSFVLWLTSLLERYEFVLLFIKVRHCQQVETFQSNHLHLPSKTLHSVPLYTHSLLMDRQSIKAVLRNVQKRQQFSLPMKDCMHSRQQRCHGYRPCHVGHTILLNQYLVISHFITLWDNWGLKCTKDNHSSSSQFFVNSMATGVVSFLNRLPRSGPLSHCVCCINKICFDLTIGLISSYIFKMPLAKPGSES